MAVKIKGQEYVVRGIKTRDIPRLSRIVKKMDIKPDFKMLDELKNLGLQQKALGINLFIEVFAGLGEAEEEVYQLLADLSSIDVDVIKDLDLSELYDIVMEFKNVDTSFKPVFSKLVGLTK
ncbi:hypothetical protein [Bacillus cereus group sp. BfR-BA-01356]|uniref:hypothetical protein n=1 Tax=Bacillus cereus group sp. BfR-BA-01356 TaxID=2920319 RepID=UPI001F5772AF